MYDFGESPAVLICVQLLVIQIHKWVWLDLDRPVVLQVCIRVHSFQCQMIETLKQRGVRCAGSNHAHADTAASGAGVQRLLSGQGEPRCSSISVVCCHIADI